MQFGGGEMKGKRGQKNRLVDVVTNARQHLCLAVAANYLVLSCTGCFRYVPQPEAIKLERELSRLESEGRTTQACELVASGKVRTARSQNFYGECLEKQPATPDKKGQLEKIYNTAASCGDTTAAKNLFRMGVLSPKQKYAVGDTSILLFDMGSPGECGLEREVTAIGWVVSPIGVPAYFVGATAAVGAAAVIATTFLAVAIVYAR